MSSDQKRHVDTVWTADRAFEDFAVGDVVTTPGRTIEAADISVFAGLTGDFYPLHVDEEFAKGTSFGGRIAHGPLTFSIASGLVFLSGYLGTAIKAMLECRSLKAFKPVHPGDTIKVQAEVIELAEFKRPDFGVITMEYRVLNQRAEVVMECVMVMLARRRTPPSEQGDPRKSRS